MSTTRAEQAKPDSAALAKWGIRSSSEQQQCCVDTGLIDGLIPKQSLSLIVGDSGIGKSPLLYQAALCVAAGIPFLGHKTLQGNVLYCDFENGTGQVDNLIRCLMGQLELSERPIGLLPWNYNDEHPNWKREDLPAMVRDLNASWVIIDSLSAFAPHIEDKTSIVTEVYQTFRRISHEHHATISGVHHIRKPSSNGSKDTSPALEEDPHGWLLEARGARALVNGADVRIGIDLPQRISNSEAALVLAGFARISGDIPLTYLSRIRNDDDEPIGYKELTGVDMLWNDSQRTAYHTLPTTFRFKDAKAIYKRGDQATSDFLKKCLNLGILLRGGPGEYRKVTGVAE